MDIKLLVFLLLLVGLLLVPDSEQQRESRTRRRRRRRRRRRTPQPEDTASGRLTQRCQNLVENYSDLNGKTIEEMARRWAPAVKLAEGEQFRPSSVDYFLRQVSLSGNGGNTPDELTPENLPQCTSGNCYLKTDLNCADCTNKNFLRGQDPASVPVYVIIDEDDENDAVDIWYWFFFPYNRGKIVDVDNKKYLNKVIKALPNKWEKFLKNIQKQTYGNHVGDWEKIKIRFEKKKLHSMYLATHDSSVTKKYAGEFLWDGAGFKKGDKRIEMQGCTHGIAYAAKGSHGFWPSTGKHTYKKIISVFKLIDECSNGDAWNTWDNLKITKRPAEGELYQGEFNFFNYQGRWGNKERSCVDIDKKINLVFEKFRIKFKQCILNSGPKGPTKIFE